MVPFEVDPNRKFGGKKQGSKYDYNEFFSGKVYYVQFCTWEWWLRISSFAKVVTKKKKMLTELDQ